jgi:predicted MPP superfamily phosphohydrolase
MIRQTDTAEETRAAGSESAPDIEFTIHDVPMPGLKPESTGLRLVQLSDLHWGCGDTSGLLHDAVARANALEPDFVFLTGDFVDDHKRAVLPAVRLVSELRARLGVYAVLGNHDHRSDPVLLESALEAAGIRVLTNTAVEAADELWVAGVDDLYEGKPDLQAALASIPEGKAALLLSHHPGALDRVPHDRPLLILSGHTHGSQFVLPFPTPAMICWWHLRTRYVHGWYRRGNARLYVNRGLGVTGPRFLNRRIHCPPEISEFRLEPATQQK